MPLTYSEDMEGLHEDHPPDLMRHNTEVDYDDDDS